MESLVSHPVEPSEDGVLALTLTCIGGCTYPPVAFDDRVRVFFFRKSSVRLIESMSGKQEVGEGFNEDAVGAVPPRSFGHDRNATLGSLRRSLAGDVYHAQKHTASNAGTTC